MNSVDVRSHEASSPFAETLGIKQRGSRMTLETQIARCLCAASGSDRFHSASLFASLMGLLMITRSASVGRHRQRAPPPTLPLLCRRSALICPTAKTSFANHILKLRSFSHDLLFICIHQCHPAATGTPGTLNLGLQLVASIAKTSALSFCCLRIFFFSFFFLNREWGVWGLLRI